MLLMQVGSAFASESALHREVSEVLGTPYKAGGVSVKGFDCSGFTMFVFNQLGIDLPHSSRSQAGLGDAVAKDDLRPGDLVFFNTDGKRISHVGIYMGNGQFSHASSNKGISYSKLSDSYYSKRYVTARRIFSGTEYTKIAVAKQLVDSDQNNDDSDSVGE